MKRNRYKIVNEVCEGIIKGLSLRKSLIENNKISRSTFFQWIREDENLLNHYARACEERQELIFEDILNISDDNGQDTRITEEGIELTNHDVIQRARLRVDARKWALGKMNPKKYGDKVETILVGDQEKPLIISLGTGIKPSE